MSMTKRVRLTSTEVETEMQKARECRVIDGEIIPFIGGVEKSYTKDAIVQAKTNGRQHDKMTLVVNPLYIHIPEWQRDIRIDRALYIGNNYNSAKWETPKIICIGGKFYVVDGQHRIYGTFKSGIECIVVEYLDITEKEAIDLFLNQTKERTGMTPADYYKAAIAGEKADYLQFRDICKKNNVRIKGDTTDTVKNPVGIFTSLSDGIGLVNSNPELLNRILKLIGKLQWNGGETLSEGKAYSAKVIRVLKKLYAYYDGREKELESILLNNCKGAVYFRNNLYEKWQDSLFDFLADICTKNSDVVIMSQKKACRTKMA